jgi:hypothetical protein
MQIADGRLSAELREALGLLTCPPPSGEFSSPTPDSESRESEASGEEAGAGRLLKALPINCWVFGGLEEGMFPGHHAQPDVDAVRSPPMRLCSSAVNLVSNRAAAMQRPCVPPG